MNPNASVIKIGAATFAAVVVMASVYLYFVDVVGEEEEPKDAGESSAKKVV